LLSGVVYTGHFRKDGAVENTLFENDQITKQQDHWLLTTNIRTHLLKQLSYPIQYWNYVLRILINLKGVSWMGHNGWIARKKNSLEEQFQLPMVMVIKADLIGKRSDKKKLIECATI
jgi:hypothetical protein